MGGAVNPLSLQFFFVRKESIDVDKEINNLKKVLEIVQEAQQKGKLLTAQEYRRLVKERVAKTLGGDVSKIAQDPLRLRLVLVAKREGNKLIPLRTTKALRSQKDFVMLSDYGARLLEGKGVPRLNILESYIHYNLFANTILTECLRIYQQGKQRLIASEVINIVLGTLKTIKGEEDVVKAAEYLIKLYSSMPITKAYEKLRRGFLQVIQHLSFSEILEVTPTTLTLKPKLAEFLGVRVIGYEELVLAYCKLLEELHGEPIEHILTRAKEQFEISVIHPTVEMLARRLNIDSQQLYNLLYKFVETGMVQLRIPPEITATHLLSLEEKLKVTEVVIPIKYLHNCIKKG